MERKPTRRIQVGTVAIGGGAPVSVQSMTNTDTKDIASTVRQVLALKDAGCDLIRCAINDEMDAKAIFSIKEKGGLPLIADIQFDHRLALLALENGCDCLRINPGNIGGEEKVRAIVKLAKETDTPIRVGVNSGSLHQSMIDRYGGVNPLSLAESALLQVRQLEEMGFTQIKVAIKSSRVMDTIHACRLFSQKSDYPLHLGITEAGPPSTGRIKSAVGIGTLLAEGIGDTIRVSLTADPVEEVRAGVEILKACGLRKEGLELISCPTCARTKIDLLSIVKEAEQQLQNKKVNATVAIMGCAVNGPGEAREADIGIAGGKGEGLLFKKGTILRKVPEDQLLDALLQEIAQMERNTNEPDKCS